MNRTQVEGLLRDAGKLVAAFFITKGWIDDSMVPFVISVVSFGGLSAWSWYVNKTTTMISAIATSSHVEKVVTTPEIAKADPNPKVVSQ